MKIKVNNKSLTRCLETVTKALAQKAILPIHSMIYFVVKDNSCSMYAQNGTLQIKGVVHVESEENINICIPGNIFMNTIRLLNEEEIILDYKEEGFVLQIIAGKKKYKITGIEPKDYTLQEVKGDKKTELKLPALEFVKYIKTTSSIVKWDDIRQQMAGVTMLVNKGKIDITGTHEAFFFYRAATSFETDKAFEIILHKEMSLTIGSMKGSGDADIVIGKKSISITLEGFELTSTLIDAKPLFIEKFIDYNKESYIVANKQDLLMAIRRSMNYSFNGVVMAVDINGSEIKFSAENISYGVNSEDVIDIENNNTEDIRFGINLKFLMAILQNIEDEKVKIFVSSSPQRPIYIIGNDNVDTNETWGCALMHLDSIKQ